MRDTKIERLICPEFFQDALKNIIGARSALQKIYGSDPHVLFYEIEDNEIRSEKSFDSIYMLEKLEKNIKAVLNSYELNKRK